MFGLGRIIEHKTLKICSIFTSFKNKSLLSLYVFNNFSNGYQFLKQKKIGELIGKCRVHLSVGLK